ncbi:MAG: stage sporulation protein [Paenibacillaceae bacterium]|jgi:stage II sporulation protein P|nr:stage sporulation protein [Paenibacillaceae bacterium]
MKWTAVTINLHRVSKTVQYAGTLSKVFIALSVLTLLFIALLGLAGTARLNEKQNVAPVSSMKGFAASVSSNFFMDMAAMEIPHLKNNNESSFSQNNVMSFVFRFLTDINTQDPKTLVAREVPGMANDRSVLLRRGVASSSSDAPFDSQPANISDMTGGTDGGNGGTGSGTAAPTGSSNVPQAAVPGQPAKTNPKPPSAGPNIAFIYHSHNQESYLPELSGVNDPDLAYNPSTNVTEVGTRLAARLEQDGVGAVHSDTNYPATVKDFKYAYSYKYSLQTLKDAAAKHGDLQYYFDIHRDSQVRGKTTVTIDGVDYAQVYFILGEKNPHWEQNEQFATKIHEALEAAHPGISKGIHAKGAAEGNGEYNQSFSPNSVLIEIGGPYNTLEECYRTADWLGDAIASVITNAQKVNGSDSGAAKKN